MGCLQSNAAAQDFGPPCTQSAMGSSDRTGDDTTIMATEQTDTVLAKTPDMTCTSIIVRVGLPRGAVARALRIMH